MKKKLAIFKILLLTLSLFATSSFSLVPVAAYDKYDDIIFDYYIYVQKNPEVAGRVGADRTRALNDWLNRGKREGKTGSYIFDAKYYLEKHPDLKNAFGSDYKRAYEHFKTHGLSEGRESSPVFNISYYKSTQSALSGKNNLDILRYFINIGMKNGDCAHPNFDPKSYINRYPDLNSAFGTTWQRGFKHYILHGIGEGRNGAPGLPPPPPPTTPPTQPSITPPPPPTPPTQVPLKTTFLRNDGKWSSMYFFSESIDDSHRYEIIETLKNSGANSIELYAINEGDYQNSDYHKDGLKPVVYTEGKKAKWIEWINLMRKAGLEPTFWMMSDDNSPKTENGKRFFTNNGYNINNYKTMTGYWDKLITDILQPMKIKRVVLGLEAMEYWTSSEAKAYGEWLRSRCNSWGAQVCYHTLSNGMTFSAKILPDSMVKADAINHRDIDVLNSKWIDLIYYQYSFDHTPAIMASDTKALISKYGNKIVAAEYSTSGQSPQAQELGDAAIKAGALGALTGFK